MPVYVGFPVNIILFSLENPFSERSVCAWNETGGQKSCLPYKMAENLPCVSSPFNIPIKKSIFN